MPIIRKFIEWLSYHPTTEEIARALGTEYLAEFSVLGVRFGRINNDDSVTVLGQYGYPDADKWRERNVPSAEWRAVDSDHVRIIVGKLKTKWTADSTMYVIDLRDRGVVQGHLIIEFHNPVSEADKHRTAEAIDDLSVPLALYLSFLTRPIGSSMGGIILPIDSRDAGNAQLSQRQILILRGMVEGKTNHELATELGFSVSTIRQETMRIYQALAVSDRKEAAKKALMLSLV
ncbi:MAG: helix-turn-helix transcriptional regulator [Actinobacteria bacterium]|nr:helix-turn-helix transcriptional regulator [Actinomycetota bacterium]